MNKAVIIAYLKVYLQNRERNWNSNLHRAHQGLLYTSSMLVSYLSKNPVPIIESKGTAEEKRDDCNSIISKIEKAEEFADWMDINKLILEKAANHKSKNSFLALTFYAALSCIHYYFEKNEKFKKMIGQYIQEEIKIFFPEKKYSLDVVLSHIREQCFIEQEKGFLPRLNNKRRNFLLNLCAVGNSQAILMASSLGMFENIDYPKLAEAPNEPYLPGLSHPPKYNVHIPMPLQRRYFMDFLKDNINEFNDFLKSKRRPRIDTFPELETQVSLIDETPEVDLTLSETKSEEVKSTHESNKNDQDKNKQQVNKSALFQPSLNELASPQVQSPTPNISSPLSNNANSG